MRVAIYARFSSDLQNERSIDDQIASCQRLLERNGWAAAAIYADKGISGASMATRPELLRLIADVKARRIDVVVAEAIDRLSRDQADIALIHRATELAGVKIVTLSEGEIGLLQIGLAGTMAHMFLKQLGDKTRRGMEGRVRAGRSGGGRCYGYALVAGDIGARTIVPDEAAIIRRIYTAYAAGVSPRAIAAALNAERTPGPRGGTWTAASINGDRRVGDGILCNALYRGELVFGRRRFLKDPETGRRRGLLQPETEWLRQAAPELRIVDEDLWNAVQRRRAELTGIYAAASQTRDAPRSAFNATRRPKRLLSGLLRCSACGGGMIVIATGVFGCAASRDRGVSVCANRRTIKASLADARVLRALNTYLMSPDVVAAAVQRWQEETTRLAADARRAVQRIDRDIAETRRRLERIADTMLVTGPSSTLVERLKEEEARIATLRLDRDAYAPEEAVALHPGAADFYRIKIAHLESALANGGFDADAFSEIRALIDKVVATPLPDGAWDLVVHGRLAALLTLGANAKDPAGGTGGVSRTMVQVGAGARTAQWHSAYVRIAA